MDQLSLIAMSTPLNADLESEINKQINKELFAHYTFLSMVCLMNACNLKLLQLYRHSHRLFFSGHLFRSCMVVMSNNDITWPY